MVISITTLRWKWSHLTSLNVLGQKWSYVMWHLLQCQLMHNRCEVITYRSVPHMHCTACTSTLSNKCSTKPRVELTVMIGTSLSEHCNMCSTKPRVELTVMIWEVPVTIDGTRNLTINHVSVYHLIWTNYHFPFKTPAYIHVTCM